MSECLHQSLKEILIICVICIIGVGVATQVLKGFCETATEPQNIFLHLRKECNKCLNLV